MDWRFSLKVELTRKADKFDVRGEEKEKHRCCLPSMCRVREDWGKNSLVVSYWDGEFHSEHITGQV